MTDENLIVLARAAGLEGEPTPGVLTFVRNLLANERLECLRILSDKRLSRFGVIEQITARGKPYELGARVAREGGGLSHLWGAVSHDGDLPEAQRGYEEALAQPEQETVTWRNAAIRVGEDLCSVGPFGYYDMTAEQWLYWALSVVTVHAPPPQRKPLTDEEIIAHFQTNMDTGSLLSFADGVRYAEAAHGIKGEA